MSSRRRGRISPKRAREIMGQNFFGIEEAIWHFGVKPTRAGLSTLAETSFREVILRECGNTHVLVAILPLSILGIRRRVGRKLFHNHPGAWYDSESFAKVKGEACWQLVRKTPIDKNFGSKTRDEEQALLGEDEGVPSARVLVYTTIGHYLATGERLFERAYARSSDVDSDGDHVVVGFFNSVGLDIDRYWDSVRVDNTGPASALKLD